MTGTLPRDERRRRTEEAIRDAAREAFAECGYERATIRGVAGRAGVDPALVMQYFGSKEGLFAAAARWGEDHRRVQSATRAELPVAVLEDFLGRFEDAAERDAAIAVLRSSLTHPEAARILRDEVVRERAAAVATIIGGEDAELRAGLIGAWMLGLAMARYMVELPGVADAERDALERVMTPALRALLGPDG